MEGWELPDQCPVSRDLMGSLDTTCPPGRSEPTNGDPGSIYGSVRAERSSCCEAVGVCKAGGVQTAVGSRSDAGWIPGVRRSARLPEGDRTG